MLEFHDTSPATLTPDTSRPVGDVYADWERPAHPALPRTLSGWTRLLWTDMLFSGQAPLTGPAPRWHWALFLVLPALFLYPCMSFYLVEPDEGRYAQIPREMLERGDWIIPVLQDEPYLDKPPLFYWLVMLSYSVLGYHAWAARLVPALAMHLSLLACYGLGRKLIGERSAFWGTLVLTLAPGYLGIGRLLLLDGVLTCCVTLALLLGGLAWRRDADSPGCWLLAALACGLGVLTKGPVALMLVVPPLWLHFRLNGIGPRGWTPWLRFGGLVLAMNLPWYAAACWQLPEFARYFFWEHNVIRFLDAFDHPRPVWFYVPILLASFVPWIFFGRRCLRFLTVPLYRSERCPELGFFLLAGGGCVLFFSLSGCKLPTYILPAFPPLALAIGCCLTTVGLRWKLIACTMAGVIIAIAHYGFAPWYAARKTPLNDLVVQYCSDRSMPVFCFPRNVDSVAFYVGRRDFKSYRSKEMDQLIRELESHDRSVVLFGHRSSLDLLRSHLPPHLHIAFDTPMGLCDLGIVIRR